MDEKKKKKEYEVPEAELVSFVEKDIITVSNGGDDPGFTGEDWEG